MTFLAYAVKKKSEKSTENFFLILPSIFLFFPPRFIKENGFRERRHLIEASLHRRAGKYPLAIRSTNELQLFPS